jgi:hypothetical protein
LLTLAKNFFKKKEQEKVEQKTDSYVFEKNIHFPTDLNLLWDAVRCPLRMIAGWLDEGIITGWRKVKSIEKEFKSCYRHTSNVVFKGRDAAQVPDLMERMKTRYPQGIRSMSFDKAFFSKTNFECVQAAVVEVVVMPKKGKKNKEEQQYEGTKKFKTLRNKHSAIESSINMLEHHGANRCPDKGHKNYCRYIALSVLANNLHIIGNHLLQEEKARQQKLAA